MYQIEKLKGAFTMKKLFFAITTVVLFLCIVVLGGCNGGTAITPDNTDISLSLPINHVVTAIPVELLAFRFDDYENLSISEYRKKVFDVIAQNENEYLSLLESVSSNSEIQEVRYTDENAYFIANILIPTIAEKWNTWRFHNSSTGDYYSAEYSIYYTILNADNITMGERNEAICSIMDAVQETLDSRTAKQLSDEAGTQTALNIKIKELVKEYTTDSFQIEAELLYRTDAVTPPEITGEHASVEERGDVGTEEDYQLLLSLKTDGYENKSVSDFLQSYVELAQTPGFEDAYARVSRDISYNDIHAAVTNDEMNFLKVTLEAASQEFIAKYQNDNELSALHYRIEKQISETVKGKDISVFELLIDYNIMYSILNDTELTVGERDASLLAVKNGVEYFVDSRTVDELANGKSALETEIEKLEQQYSNSKMQVIIHIISYQAFDQRSEIQSLQ